MIMLGEVDSPTLAMLGKLDRLSAVTLSGEWLTDERLDDLLPILRHIEAIDVRSPRVDDRGIVAFCRCRTLKHVSLARAAITDEGLAPLARLSGLESLEVRGTPITGAGLRYLRQLTKLREVVLDNDRLKETELLRLQGLASLRTLELHNRGISDGAVDSLKQLKGLKRLCLHGTDITDAGIDELRKALPNTEIIGGSLAVSQEKMARIGSALHAYHGQHGHFPPAVLTGPDGKTTCSWRVALLPFLGANSLYLQYRLDQPWDSETNRRLLGQMPDAYRGAKSAADSQATAYLAVTGPKTAFADTRGTAIRQLADGTTNVVMLVEAKSSIPWTKPEDISREERDLPKLAAMYKDGFNALMADGQPRFFHLPFQDENELALLIRKSAFVLRQQEILRAMTGQPAPDFTLKDLAGKDVTLAPLIAGKVALIVFSGVRCPPCRFKAPHLAVLYRRHRSEGLVVLTVNPWDESADLVRQCAGKEKPPFLTLLGGSAVARDQYHSVSTPTTYFVNRDGIIAQIHFGFEPGDERTLEREIVELLGGRSRLLH